MEFVSDSEYITTLLLIPLFSFGLFLIISFLEILEKHGEILFIDKKHNYTNKDFILPLALAVLVGGGFYWFFFILDPEILPPANLPPQPCAEFINADKDGSKHRACTKEYLDDHTWSIWDLF